jgi:hypothetical protein
MYTALYPEKFRLLSILLPAGNPSLKLCVTQFLLLCLLAHGGNIDSGLTKGNIHASILAEIHTLDPLEMLGRTEIRESRTIPDRTREHGIQGPQPDWPNQLTADTAMSHRNLLNSL